MVADTEQTYNKLDLHPETARCVILISTVKFTNGHEVLKSWMVIWGNIRVSSLMGICPLVYLKIEVLLAIDPLVFGSRTILHQLILFAGNSSVHVNKVVKQLSCSA